MDNREREIHAYLDEELSASERRAFEARCLAESDLGAEVERLRQLRSDLGQLPAPETDEQRLADSIMRQVRLHEHKQPWWSSLLRPIQVPVWAAATAALLLVGTGTFALRSVGPVGDQRPPQELVSAEPVSAEPVTAGLPHAPAWRAASVATVPMRFMISAPKAQRVSLVGDFNGWQVDRDVAIDPDQNGVWTVTVDLEPGRYQYKFVVDGEWVADPDAGTYAIDGFGGRNAVITL